MSLKWPSGGTNDTTRSRSHRAMLYNVCTQSPPCAGGGQADARGSPPIISGCTRDPIGACERDLPTYRTHGCRLTSSRMRALENTSVRSGMPTAGYPHAPRRTRRWAVSGPRQLTPPSRHSRGVGRQAYRTDGSCIQSRPGCRSRPSGRSCGAFRAAVAMGTRVGRTRRQRWLPLPRPPSRVRPRGLCDGATHESMMASMDSIMSM